MMIIPDTTEAQKRNLIKRLEDHDIKRSWNTKVVIPRPISNEIRKHLEELKNKRNKNSIKKK